MYRYKCPKCGKEISVLRKVEEADNEFKCPKCGINMKRQIGNVAVKFKGKGYYSTDK